MPRSSALKDAPRAKRGRPSKFGRPSQLVALTLPEEVVRGLHKVHPDLAWAVVKLFEKLPEHAAVPEAQHSPELARIAARHSLIVVNPQILKSLPGVSIVPLANGRAFLALDPGRGVTDLELAVGDRLEDPSVTASERTALKDLRAQLRRWRHDRSLRFHARTIIVVERVRKRDAASNGRGAR